MNYRLLFPIRYRGWLQKNLLFEKVWILLFIPETRWRGKTNWEIDLIMQKIKIFSTSISDVSVAVFQQRLRLLIAHRLIAYLWAFSARVRASLLCELTTPRDIKWLGTRAVELGRRANELVDELHIRQHVSYHRYSHFAKTKKPNDGLYGTIDFSHERLSKKFKVWKALTVNARNFTMNNWLSLTSIPVSPSASSMFCVCWWEGY